MPPYGVVAHDLYQLASAAHGDNGSWCGTGFILNMRAQDFCCRFPSLLIQRQPLRFHVAEQVIGFLQCGSVQMRILPSLLPGLSVGSRGCAVWHCGGGVGRGTPTVTDGDVHQAVVAEVGVEGFHAEGGHAFAADHRVEYVVNLTTRAVFFRIPPRRFAWAEPAVGGPHAESSHHAGQLLPLRTRLAIRVSVGLGVFLPCPMCHIVVPASQHNTRGHATAVQCLRAGDAFADHL